jgi:hypothetical protein
MPIDRESVHFAARGAGETLVLQDNQRDVEMPLQVLAGFQLASHLQEFISIESAVLGGEAFRKSR